MYAILSGPLSLLNHSCGSNLRLSDKNNCARIVKKTTEENETAFSVPTGPIELYYFDENKKVDEQCQFFFKGKCLCSVCNSEDTDDDDDDLIDQTLQQ